MRILILHNKYKFRGGEDTVCENEAEMLSMHGHTVKIEYFDNQKIEGWLIKISTAILCIFNPFSAFRIYRIIRSFKPDIIHIHNYFPLISSSIFWLSKLTRIPAVFTLHNFRLICPNALSFINGNSCQKCFKRQFGFYSILNRCYRDSILQSFLCALMNWVNIVIGTWKYFSPQFIVLSDFAKNLFIENAPWLNKDKFEVKPNFSKDFGMGNELRDDFYLYVGRLSKEKGIDTLIKSLDYHNRQIRIIGTGPLDDTVVNATKKYSNLRYEGGMNNLRCIEFMKKCKAMVFTSVWIENFPMTILEALSTGTPIIYSMTGALPDIIPNGYAGIGYNPITSAIALAEAIEQFEESDKKNDFYRNSRSLYEKKFTQKTNLKLLIDIYEKEIRKIIK